MDKQVKQEWVTALRSGEYTQTTGSLRTESGHCCLGVLCDIYHKHFPDSSKWIVGQSAHGDEFQVGVSITHGVPPLTVADWAGIPKDRFTSTASTNPMIKGLSLAEYNDSGDSFAEIADLIEKHL